MHRTQCVRSPKVNAEMQTQNKKPRAPQPEKHASKTTVRHATRRVPDKCTPAHDNEQPSTSKALYGVKRPTTTVTVTIEPPPATMLNSPTAKADIISRATGGESARINTTPVSGMQQAQLENILRRIDFGRRPHLNRLIENVISDLKTLIFVKEHERDLERMKALLLRLRRSSDIFHKGVTHLKGDSRANNQNIIHDVIITTPCTDNTHPKATTTLYIEDESDIESRGCTEYLFWVDVKRSINAFMRELYSHCWVPHVERNMCMEPAFKLKLDRLTTVFSNGAQLLTNS
ncbi:hypothetical protein FKM82_022816 [Ascaphus truei]